MDEFVVALAFFLVGPAFLEHFAVHADGRQRCFELVADRRYEILLLPGEVDLTQSKAVQDDEAPDKNHRQNQRDPGKNTGASARRQTIDTENEFQAIEGRRQPVAIQQRPVKHFTAAGITRIVAPAERTNHIVLVRDDQVRHGG